MTFRSSLTTLLLAGCAQPRGYYGDPAAPPTSLTRVACEGLEVHDTVHFAGAYGTLAHDGEVLYAASSGRIDIIAEPGASASDHIPVPGETHHILVAGQELWIASGTAGLTRVSKPREPAERTATHWPWPGDLRSLAITGGQVWAADRSGRILTLPQDADSDSTPLSIDVDGWPSALAPHQDGVLVAAREPGFATVRLVNGQLEVRRPDQDQNWAGPFLSEGDEIWVNTHDNLVHLQDMVQVGIAPTPPLARVVPWRGDYVLAAAKRKGVLQWDGASVATYALSLRIPSTDEEAPAYDIVPVDDEHIAVGAGRAGVLWAQDQGTGWSVEAWTPTMGEWEAVAPLEHGLAAALTTSSGESVVLLLDLDDQGELVERDRIPVPSQVTGLLQVRNELLVSTLDVFSIDLGRPVGQREAVRLGIIPEPIHGLQLLPSGRVAGLIRGRALVWFEHRDSHWELAGESSLQKTFSPMAIVSHGETVGVTQAGHGNLRLFDTPGDPPWAEHLLAGQLATSDAGILRAPGVALLEDRLWFALPHIGVEGLTPGDMDHDRILFQPGAWDVKPWGGQLAVALSQGGVGVLDPTKLDEPWVARCDLPGDTRKLVPLGDSLIAFGGGTATVLTRK
jgi:hypothetical protein